LVLSAALLCVAAPAAAQTTGGIRGRVANAVSGAALGGVVVVARSPALQGEQIGVSERDGSFTLTFLPPGIYSLRFELEQFRVEQMQNVEVQLGQTTPVSIDLVPVSIEAERIVVTGTAPAVDRGSTEIGTNIGHEFIRATPSARRYSQILRETPGATSDAYGVSVFGATSVENTYIVEGLNTTDTGFGRAGADMNTDFFDEIEVKTGGYMPEFGRSTGGIFNLVLQSGSNDLHGEVFVNVSPGFLRARETPIYRVGEAIGRRDEPNLTLDAGFSLGGPILRDRLWFFGGFNPEFRLSTVNRFFQTRFDAIGDGIDSDPEFGLCADGSGPGSIYDCADGDGDGLGDIADAGLEPRNSPDGEPDLDANGNPRVREVDGTNEELDRTRITYFLAGKLTFAATPDHRLSLSYFGNPYTNAGVLRAIDDSRTANGVSGSEAYYNADRSIGSHNVLLNYQGQLMERRMQVEAFAGVHAEHDVLMPESAAQRAPADQHIYPTELQTFERGCPENDSTPFIDCQVSDYVAGGLGGFYDESLNRYTAGFRLTNLLSGHRIRYGFDTELKTYASTRGYTGGHYGLYYGPSADLNGDGIVDDVNDDPYAIEYDSFANYDDNGNIFIHDQDNNPSFEANVQTLTFSAFLQDSWEIDRYFTINGGLRWDYEQLGGTSSDSLITIPDEFAPRIGFSFDPTGRGRARLFASWGMFYESVPLDINQRAFSNEGLVFRQVDDDGNPICWDAAGVPVPGGAPPACTYDPYTSFDQNGDGEFSPDELTIYGAEDALVANNLSGQFHEEFVVGGEVEVVPNWVVGLQAVSRRLGRVIEDISPDGGNTFFIANPGVNDCDVAPEYREALTDACSPNGTYDTDATVFPEPTRTYLGLVFSLRKRLADHSQILASYTLSRTYGDYPGLYAPDNDQLDPNLSSQYDLVELLPNRLGLLPNDHTHSLKVAGSYELGGVTPALKGLTIGLGYHGESGSPYSVLGRHRYYGRLEAFVLPRGTGCGNNNDEDCRTPFTHQFDATVGYDIPIGSAMKLNFNVTVFNFLNFQEAILVDQEYTSDVVLPQAEGSRLTDDPSTANDETLLNVDGDPAVVNPTFGEARLRQAPLSVRLGARLTF